MFINRFSRFQKPAPKYKINDQITADPVRVISDKGESLGVMALAQARQLASERNVDLVQLAQTPQETIVKLIEFGKFKYLQEKQERKQKIQQKESGPKIVRIGFITQAHDLEVRAKQAEKFLNLGHQVQIELVLRGRQKAHREMAVQKINEFLPLLKVNYKKLQEKTSPRGLNVLITKS